MLNYIKTKIMAFKDIFKDENSYNEKTIIRFLSFALFVIFSTAVIVTGFLCKYLPFKSSIFN